MPKTILNRRPSGPIGLGAIYMKIRKNNNVIDLTSAFYAEKETKLLWPIEPRVACDES